MNVQGEAYLDFLNGLNKMQSLSMCNELPFDVSTWKKCLKHFFNNFFMMITNSNHHNYYIFSTTCVHNHFIILLVKHWPIARTMNVVSQTMIYHIITFIKKMETCVPKVLNMINYKFSMHLYLSNGKHFSFQ